MDGKTLKSIYHENVWIPTNILLYCGMQMFRLIHITNRNTCKILLFQNLIIPRLPNKTALEICFFLSKYLYQGLIKSFDNLFYI